MSQTLNFINLQLYYLEQYVNTAIIYNLHNITVFMFILLFISGILTSVNPCMISILPLTASYISYENNNSYKKLFFILGIISSFIIILMFTALLQAININIPNISSIYMIIIGLSLLNVISINFISLNTNSIDTVSMQTIIKDYIIGFIVGINSCSCSTPIAATVTFWISKSSFITLGILYLFCYLLGYITPLLILASQSINYINKKLTNVQNNWLTIIPFSGSAMICAGTLSLLKSVFL